MPRLLVHEDVDETTPNHEDHQEDATENDVLPGTACHVSNDPDDFDGMDIDPLSVCNITAYRCAPYTNTHSMQVNFDYQVVYDSLSTSSSQDVLAFLEEMLLEYLAAQMGVVQCEATLRGGRRSRRLAFSMEEQLQFAGVSVLPRDTVVPDEECVEILESTTSSSSALQCLPVQGGVTLLLRMSENEAMNARMSEDELEAFAEDKAALRIAILQEIKRGMDKDLYVVPGYIEKVVFVGNRQVTSENTGPAGGDLPFDGDTSTVVEPESKSPSSPEEGGLSSTTIGLIAGVAALVLLVTMAAFLLVSRRRRRGDKEGTRELDNVKPVWVGPSSSSVSGDLDPYGGLAEKDSLALQPQPLVVRVSPHRSTSTASSSSSTPLSSQNAVIYDTKSENAAIYDTKSDSSPQRYQYTSFSRSIQDFDAAMKELDELAERVSPKAHQKRPPRHEPPQVIANGYALRNSSESSLQGTGFLDMVDEGEVDDTASNSTPRRVLQMT